MDLSGETVWQGYIRLPYADISGIAEIWAKSCKAMAVVEHPPGKEGNIHCHFMICDPSIKVDTFHKQRIKAGINTPNISWISTAVQKGEFKGQLYTRSNLLKYLIKGKLRLNFVKNISPAQVEEATSSWVEPVLGNDTKTKPPKPDSQTHYQVCQDIIKKAKAEHPDWFQVSITNYFAEDEDDFTLRSDYHRHMWDLMIKELNKRKIRTSINELERFYTTIMRSDYETKTLLFQNFWRKIRV